MQQRQMTPEQRAARINTLDMKVENLHNRQSKLTATERFLQNLAVGVGLGAAGYITVDALSHKDGLDIEVLKAAGTVGAIGLGAALTKVANKATSKAISSTNQRIAELEAGI